MNFSLNELWYALNLSMMQIPFLNSWKREEGGKSLFSPTLQEEERGKFWKSLFICYAFEMFMESSIILNFSLIRGNISLKSWGYSRFLWLPKGKKPMCRKRGNFVVVLERVIHSSNSYFNSFLRCFTVTSRGY